MEFLGSRRPQSHVAIVNMGVLGLYEGTTSQIHAHMEGVTYNFESGSRKPL